MRRLLTAGLLWFAAASCGGGGDGGGGPAPIDLVTLSGDTTVVMAGTTVLMAAASAGGVPATAGVTFQWSTSDGAKATVSAAGVVTGVARGSVTITAEAFRNGTTTGITGPRTLRVRIGSVVIPAAPGTFTSIGDNVTLTAQAKDAANATVGGVTFTWSSTNPGVATVDPATGLVTAVTSGTTSVIAAAQGERAADTVTATVAQVATALSITPDTTAFNRLHDTTPTIVTATDARGHAVAGTAINWASRNQAIATVDGTGAIASTGEGTTYIVGTSGLLADSVKVVIGLVYKSVAIDSAASLPAPIASALITRLNGTLQLGLIVRDSGNTIVPNPQGITWALKHSVIATISGTGFLTGNTLTGTDTVVLVARTARDSVPLIVRQDVASIAITPVSPADLNFVGDTQTFTAQAKDAGGANIPGKTYTWSTSDVTKLAVDGAGLGTAVGRSSATGVVVRVRALVDGVKDSVNIRVKQVPNAAFLSPNSFGTLTAFGQHVTASCVVLDSASDTIPAHPCNWAAVPDSGVVSFSPVTAATTNITARKNGDANIRATAFTNIFAPNFVQVQQAAAKVKLHPLAVDTSRILTAGTMQFIDSVFDANDSLIRTPAPSVTWSSTTAFATVDAAGLVTGASAGTTLIKAVSGTGRDSAIVQVTTTAITLSGNVQPMFTSRCASCHTGVGTSLPGVQNLTTNTNSFNAIVNRQAIESGLQRVLPFVPDSSYLVHKIQGTHLPPPANGSGVRMPETGGFLTRGQINLIRNWILQGALNN